MTMATDSPAERFRNELSQRLSAEGSISLPSANILVGVIISGMEYNLGDRYHPIPQTTLQNVLRISKDIDSLGRILDIKVRVRYKCVEAIPPLALQALHTLSLPQTALLSPCPTVITLMTYIAVVYRLSTYVGPHVVHDLIEDFNRTVPSKSQDKAKHVRKVPGVGPRTIRRSEECESPRQGSGPVRTRKSSMRKRDRETARVYPSRLALSRERMLDPMDSVERLVDPMDSTERLASVHPVMCSSFQPFQTVTPGLVRPRPPIPWCMRSMETIEVLPAPPSLFGTQPWPRRTTSYETLKHTSYLPRPTPIRQPRNVRSWETFVPARTPAPLISLSLPARSKARPFPYPYQTSETTAVTHSEIQLPPSPISSSHSKRRSARGLEYLRAKLGRLSRAYSSLATV
ncbi:hypothetical protein RSOLAG1IB_06289 [Rhizoctonia solani AG-1 IB]|uniref:Uncharacterized protein n=1 Tax=Thanatephorus cucumeris (strain AG1-IB / isolate 7/3/14) TaxID=1108050 RepID=A0A0B7FAP8_THACB|nr:hypothetical protein RSOLAG1IB_06289 [Rhizoctonia solani AG-1 IB]